MFVQSRPVQGLFSTGHIRQPLIFMPETNCHHQLTAVRFIMSYQPASKFITHTHARTHALTHSCTHARMHAHTHYFRSTIMATVFTSSRITNSLNARISIVKRELFGIIKNIIVFSIVLVIIGSACHIKLLSNSQYWVPTMVHFSTVILRHIHNTCMHDNTSKQLNTTLKSMLLFSFVGLFLVGIKLNPGPVVLRKDSRTGLTIGTLNAHSAVKKAAEIYFVIQEHVLNVLLVSETGLKVYTSDTYGIQRARRITTGWKSRHYSWAHDYFARQLASQVHYNLTDTDNL